MKKSALGTLCGMLAIACLAPAVALANDTASVNGAGVVVVQGDDSADDINFSDGVTGVPDGDYDAAVWDTAAGETVTPGTGCQTVNDDEFTNSDTAPGPVVECGDGTHNAIEVDGNGGDDTITSIVNPAADLCGCDAEFSSIVINGGDGNDTIHPVDRDEGSGAATVTVDGDAGNDYIDVNKVTDAASISLEGGDGDDRVDGGGDSHETIDGGAGNDRVGNGGQETTVTGGSGQDFVLVQSYDETINTYDGEVDQIDCESGAGEDTFNADQHDTFANQDGLVKCGNDSESTINVLDYPSGCPVGDVGTAPNCSKPASKCPAGETGTPPNCAKPVAKPTATLSVPKQSPVKSKDITATIGCSAACYVGAVAELEIGKSKGFTVGSKVVRLTAAGHEKVAIKLSSKQLKKLKSALRSHKTVTAKIVAIVTNASGKANDGESRAVTLTVKH